MSSIDTVQSVAPPIPSLQPYQGLQLQRLDTVQSVAPPVPSPQPYQGLQLQRVNTVQSVVPSTSIATFVMRGEDHAVNGLYETWVVTGSPDFAGASYHGSLATPLRDIVIQSHKP